MRVSIEHSVIVVPSGRRPRSSLVTNACKTAWRLLAGLSSIAPFSLSSTLYGIAASSGSSIIWSQRSRSSARESRARGTVSAVVVLMFRTETERPIRMYADSHMAQARKQVFPLRNSYRRHRLRRLDQPCSSIDDPTAAGLSIPE
jgi:hypothetical protein